MKKLTLWQVQQNKMILVLVLKSTMEIVKPTSNVPFSQCVRRILERIEVHENHTVNSQNFTWFPGVEILWKRTVPAEFWVNGQTHLNNALRKVCVFTQFIHQEINN